MTAITESPLTSGTTFGVSSVATASITPTANRLILIGIFSNFFGTPNTPTVTGCGVTWVLVNTRNIDSAGLGHRCTVLRALGSPTSGALTIAWAGQTQSNIFWSVAEFGNVDTGGSNGSAAVVQSATNGATPVTSLTVTLSAFGAAGNATYGAFCYNGTGSPAVGSGFTQIHATANNGVLTEWRADNDTSVDFTCPLGPAAGVALEIKAASPPGGHASRRPVLGVG